MQSVMTSFVELDVHCHDKVNVPGNVTVDGDCTGTQGGWPESPNS